MKNTKLIIVEGIPGSGKTSTAKYVKDLLDREGIRSELFSEGNLDHPADFESMACFTEEEYKELIEKYNDYSKVIKENTENKESDYFLCYGKLRNNKGNELPDELFHDIMKFDVCDGLSLNRYKELTLKRWRDFAEKANKGDIVYIFECCFIQNPAVIMLARHYTNNTEIINHVLNIESIVKKLNPQLLYFYQSSVRETISRVAEQRDKWWINFVIDYVCNQTYGKTLGLKGFDGAVKFFEDRREIELDVFKQLSIEKVMLDNTEYNWENRYKEIEQFLGINKSQQ